MFIKADSSAPLSDLDVANSTMMWFQIQPAISARRVESTLDTPQRNICPLPSAESKEKKKKKHHKQQQL